MEGLLQPTHLILILGVALLLFGPKKLPELGQGLGKGIRGFKDALKGLGEDAKDPGLREHPLVLPSASASLNNGAEK
jgi:sec-independent protein translocase protein TatA